MSCLPQARTARRARRSIGARPVTLARLGPLARLTSFARFTPLARVVAIAATAWSSSLAAQARDTLPARRDSVPGDSVRRIERVLVTAIRASDAAPIAQKTIPAAAIRQRQFGQDVPLLLVGAAPAMTAHTETGTNWGYSYLRLRGMDQTRINITIDGIPLNDMEDQVLYFANFADLMSSVQSVQVQRGVGTSSAGTASFAGSVNFETMPVAQRQASGDVQLQVGSFGARRVSASAASGLAGPGRRFAVQARLGVLQTNGYREHAGVAGGSALLGAGYFGDRDIVKLTALAGVLSDTLAYVGATRDELRTNRRYNPLAPDERDRFGQQMVALAYTRLVSDATSLNTTVYRNSASGSYDYFYLPDRYRFNLAHTWYGVTSAVNHQRGALRVFAGVNANDYARAHRGYLQPATTLYDNTGHKSDISAFLKASYDVGRLRWFADVQGRHAEFRYEPDANAGISERSIDWSFLNPKGGVTLSLANGVNLFASYGATTREPARSDLLAGDDDLNATNVGDYGDFTRVRPETVRDFEAGFTVARARYDLSANVYSMDFRNDIARIGAPTASGAVLRRNVGESYRRGLEVDAAWRATSRLSLGGNVAWSTNRIRQFTDSSRGTPVLRRNVEPLLTPRFMSVQRADVAVARSFTVGVEGRFQSRAFLDNTSSADRVLPSYHVLDATARWSRDRYALMVRGANLGNSQRYGSGSVSSSGTVRYFVLPARAIFVTAEMRW
ncbi:MAG: TonB-dependent receptor [Gemmatimonadaceae bacterium]|nr:TonB-dependent receptor [Gemmatimonadaceae bacterium]